MNHPFFGSATMSERSPARPHARTETRYTRRGLLRRAGGGLGFIGLAGLLQDEGLLESPSSAAEGLGSLALDPMAPRLAHFPARARRVIWIFINGGPSQ